LLADGPIMPGTWAYYDDLQRVEYNPEQALAMVKEAGYTVPAEGGGVRAKDGVALSFELVYPDETPFSSIAETLKSSWERLGMQVTLRAVPYEELLSDYLNPRTYDAALVDLNLSRSPDPDPYPFWHQAQITGGQNYSRWDDRRASEDLESARVLVDTNERARRYRNFQVRFQNELPALPLFYGVYSYGVHSQVVGVRIGPLFDPSDRFSSIEAWSMNTRRVAAQDQPTATP
jgi:peptide/nickel transport system substrate-binding protein